MSSPKRPFSLNTVLIGVNVLMLVLLVAGVMMYMSAKRKNAREEIVSKPAEIVAQLVSDKKALGDGEAVDEADASSEGATADADEKAVASTVVRERNSDQDIEDIEMVERTFEEPTASLVEGVKAAHAQNDTESKGETAVEKDGGLLDELAVQYPVGESIMAEPERAKLILLHHKDMNLVDELSGIDEDAQQEKKEAADRAMNEAGIEKHRRPNYRKVRSGLIDVAQALVRLNSRLSEAEPLPKAKNKDAITQLDYEEE